MSNQWPTDADVERGLRAIAAHDAQIHEGEPPMTDEEWETYKSTDPDDFALSIDALRIGLLAARLNS